ncbi:MAG: GNAT family N-acetyltransferase [Thalassotalea sp.]
MSFSVSRVEWKEAKPLLRTIREQVFICEWRIPKHIEFDQHDKNAVHIIVCDDDTQEAVATGRMLPTGEISRIAVLTPYRKHKVDKVVLKGLLKVAKEMGLAEVYINSPLNKVEYYRSNDFNIAGNVYMEAGIARQKLACLLSQCEANHQSLKGYLSH